MKKTEKIVAALLTIALGVLLIVLRGALISILMTVLGVGLIAFGILDLIDRLVTPSVVKIVAGVVVIVCGWVIVEAVLYIVAAALIIAGILWLYEKLKRDFCFTNAWQLILDFAAPVLCLLIGVLLLFNQGNTVAWVFVAGGIFTIAEGGLLLVGAFND